MTNKRNIFRCSWLHKHLQTPQQDSTGHNQKSTINGEIVISHGPNWLPRCGQKLTSVQIYSNTITGISTFGHELLSDKAFLRNGKKKTENNRKITSYKFQVKVVPEFGSPGALRIENRCRREFFLEHATLSIPGKKLDIHFDCRSWIYPIKKTQSFRVFFSNACYLPSETPSGLKKLRENELKSLRGELPSQDGKRKEWDRIYEYETYNDLGDPDRGLSYARPILGSPEYPYPRRLKTGRSPCKQDTLIESPPEKNAIGTYIPPDERLSPEKLLEMKANLIKAIIYFLVPAEEARGSNRIVELIAQYCSCLNMPIRKLLAKRSLRHQDSSSFKSVDDIFNMFSDRRRIPAEVVKEKLKKWVPKKLYKEIVRASKKEVENLPLPSIIAAEERAWRSDEEFGRQTLAGTNPVLIKCLQKNALKLQEYNEFVKYTSEIEKRFGDIERYTLEKSVELERIFILDHHDLFQYLKIVQQSGVCACASRTLLYFSKYSGTLTPVAIELSSSDHQSNSRVILPPEEGVDPDSRIFNPWELAKAHVAVNDSAYHLLVSHWLHTHAVVEPFIIATRRQLSVMHPIYRLLTPHFKDTIHINAFARAFLLYSGGILERTLFTGKISMELSSYFYKEWQFKKQALPKDLVKRNMARKRENSDVVDLINIKDYPYAVDGLEIWVAIKTWVTDFCQIFYKDDNSVKHDEEIQQWWKEIREKGHPDGSHEGWYELTDRGHLIKALTTLIWMASGLHAALNFGQYAYAGYPPNRTTMCRKFVPKEKEISNEDMETHFLKMLPGREEMEIVMTLTCFLSHHTSDEIYLGQRQQSEWSDNKDVQDKFNAFKEELVNIEERILQRNKDYLNKNRWGPAKTLYKLLYPDTSKVDSKGGITVRGIPNSISI